MDKQAEIERIKQKYAERNKEIERQHRKEMARIIGGGVLQGVSALPIFNIPYVGTGLGGALFETGNAIMQGKNAKDIAKDAGKGFVVGETIGAIPYVGKVAGKTKAGQAAANQASNFANRLAETKIGQKVAEIAPKVEDVLMTDIKAFNPNKQTAYHGSPADFNKFDDAYIGTGEGAQAHGMGHYAAKNRDAAQDYADKLGTYRLKNPEKVPFDYQTQRDLITAHQIGKEELIRKLQNMIEIEDYDDEIVNLKNRIENIDKNYDKVNLGVHKQLYKLTIPKDDVMLREDLPFSQQSKAVQESLLSAYNDIRKKELEDIIGARDLILETLENAKKNGSDRLIYSAKKNAEEMLPIYNKKIQELEKDYLPQNWKGNVIYSDFANKIANKNNVWGLNKDIKQGVLDAKKEASKLLNQHGIKGISYNGGIDGEARVIFNPADIEIVRKYYNQPTFNELINKNTNMGAFMNALMQD